jgi:hypothetical protein
VENYNDKSPREVTNISYEKSYVLRENIPKKKNYGKQTFKKVKFVGLEDPVNARPGGAFDQSATSTSDFNSHLVRSRSVPFDPPYHLHAAHGSLGALATFYTVIPNP